MADTFATSFGVLNYSGMLFNKGNVRTPLSSIIGSKAKTTNHVESSLLDRSTPLTVMALSLQSVRVLL